MTSNQVGKRLDRLDKRVEVLIERASRLEARLDVLDEHLKTNLSLLQAKVNSSERQLYAMYVVGGVHLMLMGFVLKQIFT